VDALRGYASLAATKGHFTQALTWRGAISTYADSSGRQSETAFNAMYSGKSTHTAQAWQGTPNA